MEKVTGIGGLFFKARDAKGLAQWYLKHLGINLVPKGEGEETWQQEAGPTAFVPFAEGSDYFGRPEQRWMINFRVRSLERMVAQLREAGIVVTVDGAEYPYGKFARLADPEGNPIELWEVEG